MNPLTRKAALTAILGLLAAGSGYSQAMAGLPPVHQDGAVEYLSGGIGKDEATAVEKASHHWPLTLAFSQQGQRRAEYTADVAVLVRDAQGHTALQAKADGPYLLARLAPGHYTVEATLAGKTLHRKVDIKAGHMARETFLWPADKAKHQP